MNSLSPLVSIVTPFLNVEVFLRDTIESVLEQDYKNWELILVDDGSTDRSTEIAKEYASQYPRQIFYYEHENHSNLGA
ncbi:MAG: glycosyltransferase family 2 protein, partial [Chitinophagaceae bacterium]|nr:glycosyltransferase family 2 protein [Chitinophagaceae bacterium]